MKQSGKKTAVPACGTRRRIPMTTVLQGYSVDTAGKDWITVTNHSNARIKTGYSYSGKPGFEAIAGDGITSGKALPTAKTPC